MSRQQNRQLKGLVKSDRCSFCKQRFPHNSRTYFGSDSSGVIKLACERCTDNIEAVYSIGLVTRKCDFGMVRVIEKHPKENGHSLWRFVIVSIARAAELNARARWRVGYEQQSEED